MLALRLGVLLAALWCAALLLLLLRRARAPGVRPLFAVPAGDPRAGVRYAFTGALLPNAKESARRHPYVWALGVAYHAGTFGALGCLSLAALAVSPPGLLAWPLGIATAVGAAAGLTLLGKRRLQPLLRALSQPDDYLANALATLLDALACIWLATGAAAPLLTGGIALLVLAPFGKLRHAAFFFAARRHLGLALGRRGVFPPHGLAPNGMPPHRSPSPEPSPRAKSPPASSPLGLSPQGDRP